MRLCPRLRRLLIRGTGITARPLRALTLARPFPRCPELHELSVRPAKPEDYAAAKAAAAAANEEDENRGGGGGGAEGPTLRPRSSPRDAPTAFDRDWDTALTLLRTKRPDICKKFLGETAQGRVRGGIPRWGSRSFTDQGALKIG